MKPPVKTTTAQKITGGKIKLTHSQSVRQSANYQSAEVVYGAEIEVEDTPKTVRKALDRLETLVEERLVPKMSTHRQLLSKLG